MSSPPAPLEFGAYLAPLCAGSFAFLDSRSTRRGLSNGAWAVPIGPVVAEIFAFSHLGVVLGLIG